MSETVFVIQFEAIPEPETFADGATGAYVNIYIQTASNIEALEIAHREVSEAGWRVLNTESVISVSAENLDPSDESYDFYQQCIADGVVMVFHTWAEDDKSH